MKKYGLIVILILATGCGGFFEDLFKSVVITSPDDGSAVRFNTISVSVRWSDPDIESISCEGQQYIVRSGDTSHTFYSISLLPPGTRSLSAPRALGFFSATA